MARLKVPSVIQILVLFVVCVVASMIGFAVRNNASAPKPNQPSALQRSDEKVVEIKEYSGKPYDVSELSVKKVKILPGEKLKVRSVAESEDWLDGLEFNIKNKWDKQIIWIHIELDFPETAVGGSLMIGNLDMGIHPQATENDKKYGKPLALNPGETVTYTLSKQWLAVIKKFLEQGGFQLANLNKVVIRISSTIFNDGTSWSEGNWFRYDPKSPNAIRGYERIKQ